MSISLSNSLPPPLSNASLTGDSSKNVEPLAVRGKFDFAIQKKKNLLVLVMRLSKPALYQNIPIYAEEESSSTATAFLSGQSHDIGIGTDHSVLSHLLVLPYSFGLVDIIISQRNILFYYIRNVFLGEIFSAIVSLHNQSDQTLQDVILKVRV
jgi:hypothetical protein